MSDIEDAHTAPVTLRGMTWDHPRGVDGLIASSDLVRTLHGVDIEWESRSLLAFGDQHIGEFAGQYDLVNQRDETVLALVKLYIVDRRSASTPTPTPEGMT